MGTAPSNPVTGTPAVDGKTCLPEPYRHLFTFVVDGESFDVDVVTTAPGVLHTSVPTGAVMVQTRGTVEGLPVCVVYRTLLHALRGERYAVDYYAREIPDLVADESSARWCLRLVHDSDDLTDPELVTLREQALEEIIDRAKASMAEHKVVAVSDAVRAMQVGDVLGRRNPMAAAMANHGLVIRLNHLLANASGAEIRVSKTLLAIVQVLANIWKTFHDIDVELASMERWWMADRRDPLTYEQAQRLAVRVERLALPITDIHEAPYARMPLLEQLQEQMSRLATELTSVELFMGAIASLLTVRRIVAMLLIHAKIAQTLVVPAKARRFERSLTVIEQLDLIRDIDEILAMLQQVEEEARFAQPGSIDFISSLTDVLGRTKTAVLKKDVDTNAIYELMNSALEMYN